jgi:hypothetical protein
MSISQTKHDLSKILTISFFVADNDGRGLPLLMTGPPGGAKTYEIAAYARAMGVPFVHISPSQRGDGYFGAAPCRGELDGIPVLNFPPPAEIVKLHQQGAGIILVDELRTAPRNVRPALLGIIQERRFGELHLHQGIRVFACSNSADESSGNGAPLDPPTANRFCHISMQDPTIQDAANFYARIAKPRTYRPESEKMTAEKLAASRDIEAKLDALRPKYLPKAAAMVLSFLRNTNGTWKTCKKYAHVGELRAQPLASDPNSDGGWGSPRSWSKVVELLTTYMSMAALTKKEGPIMGHTFVPDFSECPELLTMIDGLVGPVSTVFSAASAGLNIIDAEQWLDGKEMLVKEDSNDRVFATFQAGATFLVGAADNEPTAAEKAVLVRRADVFFGLAGEFPMDVVWPACETIVGQTSGGARDILSKTPAANRFLSKHATVIAAIKAAS